MVIFLDRVALPEDAIYDCANEMTGNTAVAYWHVKTGGFGLTPSQFWRACVAFDQDANLTTFIAGEPNDQD